ncbi:PIN2/TERF1-interacting telomerase inhibitor 1 [Polyodon spathula]|uniref:PIN2/TERF1-interacting telomerase inhibitor 1 n=1 Tax=Polyodon spathula TaxID=7913 RepID=UPI001B7EDDAF|nr:PIN2/TERF1-interacting telomerase inhibitor 1 [Polyodon spathula]
MAMLAEPRRKQKWSVDPQNSAWSKDESKFGQKMLEKMGWSKGKGLGAQEQGATENIKVQMKNNSLGLGTSVKHEDNWIAHQDDFNQLLADLNNCHGQNESQPPEKESFSLEEKSKSSRKRVHYMKFTKGKDLSNRSETDLACIFGRRQKSCRDLEEDSSSADSQGEVEGEVKGRKPNITADLDSEITNTVTSTLTMQEYFAQRMAQRKQNQSETQPESASSSSSAGLPESSEVIKVKSKKKKGTKREYCELEQQDCGDIAMTENGVAQDGKSVDDDSHAAKKKKKSKRRKIPAEEVNGHGEKEYNMEDVVMLDRKERKKIKKREEEAVTAEDEGDNPVSPAKENESKKEKKKKRSRSD